MSDGRIGGHIPLSPVTQEPPVDQIEQEAVKDGRVITEVDALPYSTGHEDSSDPLEASDTKTFEQRKIELTDGNNYLTNTDSSNVDQSDGSVAENSQNAPEFQQEHQGTGSSQRAGVNEDIAEHKTDASRIRKELNQVEARVTSQINAETDERKTDTSNLRGYLSKAEARVTGQIDAETDARKTDTNNLRSDLNKA
ncbi:hypothetical protein, partial [Endozoicomonas elysicola]